MIQMMTQHLQRAVTSGATPLPSPRRTEMREMMEAEPDSDADEEEIPEDLAHLSPAEQHRRILLRASWMMSLGTALVLVFSDPAVEVLGEIGNRVGVKGRGGVRDVFGARLSCV